MLVPAGEERSLGVSYAKYKRSKNHMDEEPLSPALFVVCSLLSPLGEGTCRILMINDHCLRKIPTEIPILNSPTERGKFRHMHT